MGRSSASGPSDRKAIAAIETARKRALWRGLPSKATKRRYNEARAKLGFSTKSGNYVDWSRISRRTTFIWKFETFEENVTWVWESSCADFIQFPGQDRATIVCTYIHKAFGVAMADIMDDQRNTCIFIPRMVAIVCLRKSHVGLNETARMMHRDHTTIINAMKRAEQLGILKYVKNTGDSRSTSDGEQGRDLPS